MATTFGICEKGNVKFRDVTGEICIEDAKLLYKCAKKYKGGVYVETGSYLGLSATLISAGIGDGKIYCHDLWVDTEDWDKVLEDSIPPPKVDGIYDKFKANMARNTLNDIVTPVRGDSKKTLHIHKDESVDFCFIDGDHSFEGAYTDMCILWNKLKPGGTMLGHDCVPGDPVDDALKKFCEERELSFKLHEPEERAYEIEGVTFTGASPWYIFELQKDEKFLYYNFWPLLANGHIMDFPKTTLHRCRSFSKT